ncbi:MgtC/SapB family protein [Stakelama tenebrarum]|uniref:Protein MgtC n=1 Tax=Stakelama tenebrarum TaxID=2711215 RepID=A0A6G6Y9C7_9SPHN|nr:MgtC/SapB family protein [Sphingosinithalassobacter tenebrarum]QIG81176.1 MgtC/SapB family protein [Sphingosinithalassobacter tenebrarum]
MNGPLPEYGIGELALRLGIATLLGALLGFNRERTGHSAGIRTHGMVSLSSAMITLIALMMFAQLRGDAAQPDPLRVVQGLAQAIGFIAAGLIFVRGGDVRNLTTAANIWLATSIGIACGAGYWQLVAVAFTLGLLLLVVVKIVKRRIPGLDGEEG